MIDPPSPIRARRHVCRAANGFALPAALMALVLIAALVAASLVISADELRAGRTDVAAQRALASAELGVERAIARWEPRLNTATVLGETRIIAASVDSRGDSLVVTATRVHDRAVWIAARGTSSADGRRIPARATIGAATRLVAPSVALQAALTVGGSATVIDATVDGRGTTATTCPGDPSAALAAVAGIAAPDSSRVCGADCTDGVPPGIVGDPAVIAAAGGLTSPADSVGMWSALERWATVTVAGGTLTPRPRFVDDRCASEDPLNWGDPAGGPCADHVPVIRITGSAVLGAGSMGQGILLVDGTLTVAAGARFDGIVIARHDVHVTGGGAELRGVVFALDADGGAGSSVRDGGAVRFDRCSVRRATLGAARLARTPERWWAELR